MSCSAIHHVEMCLKDARPTLHLFTYGLGFSVVGERCTPTCQQWVLRNCNSTFVMTQRRQPACTSIIDNCCSQNNICDTNTNSSKSADCSKNTDSSCSNSGCLNISKDFNKHFNQNGNHCSVNGHSISKKDYSTDRKQGKDVVQSTNINGAHKEFPNGTHSSVNISQDRPISTPKKLCNNNINYSRNNVTTTSEEEEWTVFCCGGAGSSHVVDSVFNAAIVVRDVYSVIKRVERRGGRVIKQPRVLRDGDGEVTYAIIATTIGNVVHTLIDKRSYRGSFLPGYNMLQNEASNLGEEHLAGKGVPVPVSTHLDHVAYVCDEGKSTEIIQWYEDIFNMKRFLVNSEEDVSEGLAIEAGVGLRLKALEYWRCFETGLYQQGDEGDTSLKLVIGEPITAIKDNHVSAFLSCHRGPGIQHIALHSPSMLATVSAMAARGVPFRQPPPTYYTQVGKLDDMERVGLGAEAEALMAAGVLLDTEADPPQEGTNSPQEGVNSAQEGVNSAQEGTNSAQEGANSAQEGANPPQEGANPPQEGANSAQEGANSPQEGANSAQEGANSAQEGANTPQEGANSAQEGANSPQEGANSPQEGANSAQEGARSRYLMQIFTEPIFGTNSFFLEVVHRAGAAGFGVGNITALARSIALHQHQPLALQC